MSVECERCRNVLEFSTLLMHRHAQDFNRGRDANHQTPLAGFVRFCYHSTFSLKIYRRRNWLMNVHHESFMRLDELGSNFPNYSQTFEFPGEFINESHKLFSTCPVREGILIEIRDRPTTGSIIEGWLRRADALKLYEIAYFVSGDILELGSYHGLSTSILARAALDSPHKKNIFSIDLDMENVKKTNEHLHEMGLKSNVITMCGDALTITRGLVSAGPRFDFVFVDHSHAYEAVYPVCRELGGVLKPGGFCLFHDFNDARNREAEEKDYGVYQAVVGGLDPERFDFYGVYGCAALYRFK